MRRKDRGRERREGWGRAGEAGEKEGRVGQEGDQGAKGGREASPEPPPDVFLSN